MQTTPKISFCTTCMNRFEQLQAVLPKNVSILKKYGPEVELVVVNFIVNEESLLIDKWIKQNFQEDLNANSFKYYTTHQLKYWHASKAKNYAHSFGKGRLLYNLDCDNYLNEKEIDFLLASDNTPAYIYHGFSSLNKFGDGTYGRICMSQQLFQQIGGYNEKLFPVGYQDSDILLRAKKRRKGTITKANIQNFAIQNNKGKTVQFIDPKYKIGGKYTWNVLEIINRFFFKYL